MRFTAFEAPTIASTTIKIPSQAACFSTGYLKNGTVISVTSLLVEGVSHKYTPMNRLTASCAHNFTRGGVPPPLCWMIFA